MPDSDENRDATSRWKRDRALSLATCTSDSTPSCRIVLVWPPPRCRRSSHLMSPKKPASRTGEARWPDGRTVEWKLYSTGQCFVGTTADERKQAGYPKRIAFDASEERVTELVNEHLLVRAGVQNCSNPRR